MTNYRLVTDQTQLGWWAVYADDRYQVSEASLDRATAEAIIPTLTPEEVENRVQASILEEKENPSHLVNG